MKIFLIGLPGCGKSTLGKEMAATLRIRFVDLDTEIEKQEGRAIKDIFKLQKEPYFRKVETTLLDGFCKSEASFVMATGGGAPVYHGNMDKMNEAGVSIFLDVPAKEIAERIAKTPVAQRPLLNSSGLDGLKDQIEFLRSQRIQFYKQATHIFSGASITSEEVVILLN